MSPNIETSFILTSTYNSNSLSKTNTNSILFGDFSKVEVDKMMIIESTIDEDYNFIADEERYLLSCKTCDHMNSICLRLESIVFGDFEIKSFKVPPTPPTSPTCQYNISGSYYKNNKNETLQKINSMSSSNLDGCSEIVFSKSEIKKWCNYERKANNKINENTYKNYVKYINQTELYELDLQLSSIYYSTYSMIYDI